MTIIETYQIYTGHLMVDGLLMDWMALLRHALSVPFEKWMWRSFYVNQRIMINF
jgi:hypothetical protein